MTTRSNQPTFFKENLQIVLASGSPRRKELFERAGLTFQTVPVDVEPEPALDEEPEAYAIRAAKAKAMAAARLEHESCVVGADTIVVYKKEGGCKIIGKPKRAEDSLEILKAFQGGRHQVITACCIVWPKIDDRNLACYEAWSDKAEVFFGSWPESVLQAYVETGEPQDKAGSFSIEGIGGFLISRIEGNLTTVLGLPMPDLLTRLLHGGAIRAT